MRKIAGIFGILGFTLLFQWETMSQDTNKTNVSEVQEVPKSPVTSPDQLFGQWEMIYQIIIDPKFKKDSSPFFFPFQMIEFKKGMRFKNLTANKPITSEEIKIWSYAPTSTFSVPRKNFIIITPQEGPVSYIAVEKVAEDAQQREYLLKKGDLWMSYIDPTKNRNYMDRIFRRIRKELE